MKPCRFCQKLCSEEHDYPNWYRCESCGVWAKYNEDVLTEESFLRIYNSRVFILNVYFDKEYSSLLDVHGGIIWTADVIVTIINSSAVLDKIKTILLFL